MKPPGAAARTPLLTRRAVLGAALPLGAALLAGGCEPRRAPGAASRRLVLYSSLDPDHLRPVLAAFTAGTGIAVDSAGDTEATKTTGLVQRLLNERDRPRADVWWSSEAIGTVRLAREGVLQAYSSPSAPEEGPGAWPAALRAPDRTWYGIGRRRRVIVHHTARAPAESLPAGFGALFDPRFAGRIGMARPEFGTTRGHFGAMLAALGEPRFRSFARALAQAKVREYDGNATVVRAVAQGEIDIGLTDDDDVFAGLRNGWPIGMLDIPASPASAHSPPAPPTPPMQTPGTIALVRLGPNPEAARSFVDFVLSPEGEALLLSGPAAMLPVREATWRAARPAEPFPPLGDTDWVAAERAIEPALAIWQAVRRSG